MKVPPRLRLLKAPEKCSSHEIFLEIYKHFIQWCLLNPANMESGIFSTITFSWKTALVKTCHYSINYSLLIIAREEYVIPSNIISAFFP